MSETIRPELLNATQVAQMLGMSRPAFAEWVKTQPTFPKAVFLGKTKGGREIRKWRRRQVRGFIDLLGV